MTDPEERYCRCRCEVDIRLEQVARLIALDPFTADERGQARLGREMQKLLTLEQRLLSCADGERPMTFKRKTPGADRISGQRVSVRKETAGVTTNRTISGILSAEQPQAGFTSIFERPYSG